MRLVLHIGTEKTATTTLQHFLYQNRDALAGQGALLSEAAGRPNNRHLPAWSQPEDRFTNFHRSFGFRNLAEKQAGFADFPDRFRAEVAGLAGDTLVLTSEHCHARLTDRASVEKLHSLLAPLFSEIRVICYFREQAAMVKSLYSTVIKSGKDVAFGDFAAKCTPRRGRYNHAITADLWSEVFGRDAFQPRLFLPERFIGGDICSDFLATAGIDGAGTKPVQANRNESLGAWGSALIQAVNRRHPRYLESGAANPVWKILERAVEQSELGRAGDFSFPEAGEIFDRFKDSNRDFAARYLGETDNPFPRPEGGTVPMAPVAPETLLAFWETLLNDLSEAPLPADKTARQIHRNARSGGT